MTNEVTQDEILVMVQQLWTGKGKGQGKGEKEYAGTEVKVITTAKIA